MTKVKKTATSTTTTKSKAKTPASPSKPKPTAAKKKRKAMGGGVDAFIDHISAAEKTKDTSDININWVGEDWQLEPTIFERVYNHPWLVPVGVVLVTLVIWGLALWQVGVFG